uniref:Uncharacterized protein n=1 Tax=Ciona savignyi TaxID=51511 RepID=H2YCR2_CIOSA
MATINNVIGFSKRFSGVKKWIYSYLKKPIENATKTIEEGFSNHGVKEVNDGVCLEIKSLQSFSWPINLQKVWRRQLKTFRSTLTGQTVRFQSQQKRNVLLGQRNFFSKDFMWKRAKQGPLLAFGGFFLFQEDEYQIGKTLQSQFNLYSNVCQNVKDLFPESCPEKHDSEQNLMDIDDIKFTRCMEIGKNKAVYHAKLKTSERSLEEISTSVLHHEPSEADVFSFDSIPHNETSSDITVHVVPV